MFQRFYQDTIVSKFIKELLASTSVSMVDNTCRKGGLVDGLYIKNNQVIYADNGTEKILSPYNMEQTLSGVTTAYQSAVVGYDSTTHMYLGNYLRQLRDSRGINLMPFYNCVNNVFIDDLHLSATEVVTERDPQYKVLSVPVRFGETYTIAIDAPSVQLTTALYGSKGFVNKLTSPVRTKHFVSFVHPFTFRTLDATTATYPYTKILRLLIQLPVNTVTSVVVLEGDYTKKNYLSNQLLCKDLNIPIPRTVPDEALSQLSLLQISDGNIYAFSDRLIEYLVYSVITSTETIRGNVARIQSYVTSYMNYKLNGSTFDKPYTTDIWSDQLREYLFTVAENSSDIDRLLDVTGNVDKTIEKLVTRGQMV